MRRLRSKSFPWPRQAEAQPSLLEALPPGWLANLCPASFAALQCASPETRASEEQAAAFWAALCAARLELKVCEVGGAGRLVALRPGAEPPGAPQRARRRWLRALRDLDAGGALNELLLRPKAAELEAFLSNLHLDRYLVEFLKRGFDSMDALGDMKDSDMCDVGMPRGHIAKLRHHIAGELRQAGAGAVEEADLPWPLAELEFGEDGRGRRTRCRLRATTELGSDRSVMAELPLAGAGAATALAPAAAPPAEAGSWRIAWRRCGYYEVTLCAAHPDDGCKPAAPAVPRRLHRLRGGARRPCVSVGLATPHVAPKSLRRQQAGWNAESWALHGDDGQLYHGRGSGDAFRRIGPLPRGARAPKRRWPSFGEGSTVGCGVISAPAGGPDGGPSDEELLGIFFALNGEFLGVTFLLKRKRGFPLHPCVGIDAHWWLDFNFGARPFALDLDALDFSPVQEFLQANVDDELTMEVDSESDEFDDSDTDS